MNFSGTTIKKTALFDCLYFFFNLSFEDNGQDTVKQATKEIPAKTSALQPQVNDKNRSDSLGEHTQVGASNYIQMLLGLFFIIAFIFGIAWLIKRMGTMHPGHSASLKIVAGISVGQREKVIVLQVMNEQLLVGVTQSNIQLLSTLKEPITPAGSPSLSGFQEKLQSAINGFTKNNDTEKK